MLGPEYMNSRRAANHEDYCAFDHTSCEIVSERLAGGGGALLEAGALMRLTNLRDK